MNTRRRSNSFTGESQEQCAVCEEWGWPDEVAKLHSSDEKHEVPVCCDCIDAHEIEQRRIDAGTVDSVLTAEQWDKLRAILKGGVK